MDRLNIIKCRSLLRSVTETPLGTNVMHMVRLEHETLPENLNQPLQLIAEFKIQDKHNSCKQ